MKKNLSKRLALHRQTMASLNNQTLMRAFGGITPPEIPHTRSCRACEGPPWTFDTDICHATASNECTIVCPDPTDQTTTGNPETDYLSCICSLQAKCTP